MPIVEIPKFVADKFNSTEPSVVFNGYSNKETIIAEIENRSVPLYWMKGNIGSGLFSVLCDPESMEWYKVGGTSGLKTKIDHEYYGISCSLELNKLESLAQKLELINPVVNFISLPAVRSPHLGLTVECLHKIENDKSLKLYLFSVYESAYIHAKEMLNQYGVWVDDPNSGNIVLRRNENNMANIIFIDFTSKYFKMEPTSKNERLLLNKFQEHANRLVHHTDIRCLAKL